MEVLQQQKQCGILTPGLQIPLNAHHQNLSLEQISKCIYIYFFLLNRKRVREKDRERNGTQQNPSSIAKKSYKEWISRNKGILSYHRLSAQCVFEHHSRDFQSTKVFKKQLYCSTESFTLRCHFIRYIFLAVGRAPLS